MKEALTFTDKQWVSKLSGLDCSVVDYTKYNIHTGQGGDFTFDNSKDLSSVTLFVFFSYVTGANSDRYPNCCLKWYDKKDGKYHVPVKDIDTILDSYFTDAHFDLIKIEWYNSKSKTIDKVIDGFGGVSFAKFVSKKILPNNTMIVTIRYYSSEEYKTIQYTKAYTIQYTNNGYKYLSIKKVNA